MGHSRGVEIGTIKWTCSYGYRRGGRQERKEVRMQLWGIENDREGEKAVRMWLWFQMEGV